VANGQLGKQRRVPQQCFIHLIHDHVRICLTAMKCKLYSCLLAPIFVPVARALADARAIQMGIFALADAALFCASTPYELSAGLGHGRTCGPQWSP